MKGFLTILLSLILVCSNADVEAQQRFGFVNVITAPISPAFHTDWQVTTGAGYGMIYPGKTTWATTVGTGTLVSGQVGASAPRKCLIYVFISQPLVAQTWNSGSTISAQLKLAMSSTSGTTGQGLIYVRKCNADGTSITEVLNMTSTNLVGPTNTNRTFTGTLGSNVTINDGDRIIIEIGWNESVGSNTTRTCSSSTLTSPSSTDLPVDNTTTALNAPWIEFSQTLNFIIKPGIK